jgi:probable F420-dependent oxidoreductase
VRLALPLPAKHHVTAMVQPWETDLGPADLVEAAVTAEQAGFDSVGVGEHFVIPADHVPASGSHYFQTTTALAYLAARTTSLTLSSHITLIPLQHPLVHAKMWSVLDWLSGGRTRLLVGVGWLEAEYTALGVDFARRGRICDEHIAAMLTIWGEQPATFDGPRIAFEAMTAAPRPVQEPHPPLWFAGDTPATMRRIARWGAGWSPFRTPPEQFGAQIALIQDDAEYDGQPIGIWYDVAQRAIGDAHAASGSVRDRTWSRDQVLDTVGTLHELGVTELTLRMPQLGDFEHYLDWVRWVGYEIAPTAHAL